MLLAQLKTTDFIMFVGLPASGKTTYIRDYLSKLQNSDHKPTTVVSTDNLIELYAMEQMKTYNEVFKNYIGKATAESRAIAVKAFADRNHVIWDQTNLSRSARASRLSLVPQEYFRKVVVVACSNEEEWFARLANRPGKTIPVHVLGTMKKSYEEPTVDEGFDEIEFIFT